jgi:copper chaperone
LRRIIKDARGVDVKEVTLHIDGMHCGSCVRRVTQALSADQGFRVLEVRLGAARLESSEDPVPVDRAVAALAKAGYSVQVEQTVDR